MLRVTLSPLTKATNINFLALQTHSQARSDYREHFTAEFQSGTRAFTKLRRINNKPSQNQQNTSIAGNQKKLQDFDMSWFDK